MLVAIVHSILLNINDAESCDLLCKQCNASAVFADNRCECNLSDNNDKGIMTSLNSLHLNILEMIDCVEIISKKIISHACYIFDEILF